ncbi:alpha/beta hydrolase [Shimia sagamensis]|nr:alpha/beta hydrolase [Shimia sagamensis]
MRIATEDHEVAYMRGTGNRLVVTLGGVGTKPNEMPPFEFVGTASQGGENHVILVTERARTWMNSPDLPVAIVKEIETVVAREAIDEVVAIGNSMGGFMALVLPTLTRVDTVVAPSPQFSMHPNVVPEETRWQKWRRRFPTDLVRQVPAPQDGMRSLVLHGDSPKERIHWARFSPASKTFNHFILRGESHDLVKALKKLDIMRPLLERAMDVKTRKVRKLLEGHFTVLRREDPPQAEQTAPAWPVSEGGER